MKFAGLGLLAMVSIVGCGGGGGGTATNPYTGSWEQEGATQFVTLTVASDGRFNLNAEFEGAQDTYQGRISGSGNVTGTLNPGVDPTLSLPVRGTVSKNNDSQITINLTVTNPDNSTWSNSATLTKVRGVVTRSAGTSPLAQYPKNALGR